MCGWIWGRQVWMDPELRRCWMTSPSHATRIQCQGTRAPWILVGSGWEPRHSQPEAWRRVTFFVWLTSYIKVLLRTCGNLCVCVQSSCIFVNSDLLAAKYNLPNFHATLIILAKCYTTSKAAEVVPILTSQVTLDFSHKHGFFSIIKHHWFL